MIEPASFRKSSRFPGGQVAWITCCLVMTLSGACRQTDVRAADDSSIREGQIDRRNVPLAKIKPAPVVPPAQASPKPPGEAASRQLRKAQESFEAQLWSEAIAAAQKAVELDAQLTEARVLLARAALRQGDIPLAQTQLQEVLDKSPREAAAYQMQGDLAFQEGKITESIRLLRLALAVSENDSDSPVRALAHLSLGIALRKEGYLIAAAGELEAFEDAAANPTAAMKSYPELNEAIALHRGKVLADIGELESQLGHDDKAAKAYESAVSLAPQNSALRGRWAQALARSGRIDAGLDITRKLLADAPPDSADLFLLKQICELGGHSDRYDTELVGLAETTKSSALKRRIADDLLARGKLEQTQHVLATVAAADPGDPAAACGLASIALKRGDPKAAAKMLADVLNLQPGSYVQVDTVLHAANDSDREALLAAAKPDDRLAASYLRGRLNELLGRAAEATKEYEAAAAGENAFGPAIAAMARSYAASYGWKRVIEATEKAISRGAAGADVYLLAGRAHLALDESEEGQKALLESFRLNPKSAEPLFELAESAERHNDPKRCEQLNKRIVDDVDPRHIPAREYLVRIYLNTERLDKAREYYSDFENLNLTGPAVERTKAMLDLATSTAPAGPGRMETYRSALKEIIQRYPKDAATRIDLATAYRATMEWDAALKETQEALSVDPENTRALELQARLLSRNLDFVGATAAVNKLLVQRPRDIDYQKKLLDLAINEANWNAVVSLIDKLAEREELKEARELLLRQQIEYLILAERKDEAIEKAKKWLDEGPAEPQRREAYLSALQAAKKKDEAISLTAKWLAEDPSDSELRGLYIQQLQNAERYVEAQQKILGWLATEPDDMGLRFLLLRLFWEAKDWDSAIELVQTGAEQSEYKAQFQSMLGVTYSLARRFDEAVHFYQAKVKQSPSEKNYDELVAVLIAAERFQEAEETINQILGPQLAKERAGEPFNAEVIKQMYQQLATIYERTQRQKAAFEQLELALKLSPNDSGLNNDLGYSYVDAGLYLDRAEQMVRSAVADQPRNPAYLDSLGWVNYKRGRFEEAAKYIERSVKFGSDRDPVIYDHWGDSVYRLGDHARAESLWRKSLQMLDEKTTTTTLDRILRTRLDEKLRRLSANETVEVAPLAPATTQPSERSKRHHAG